MRDRKMLWINPQGLLCSLAASTEQHLAFPWCFLLVLNIQAKPVFFEIIEI